MIRVERNAVGSNPCHLIASWHVLLSRMLLDFANSRVDAIANKKVLPQPFRAGAKRR